jgi:hypothetical protein
MEPPGPDIAGYGFRLNWQKPRRRAGMIGQVPAGATSALTRAIVRPRLAICMLSCGRESRRLTC